MTVDGFLPSRLRFGNASQLRRPNCPYRGQINPRRYRYRLVGTQITTAVGRSLTGRYFDTLYGDEYYRRMAAHFEEIILSKTAIRTVGNMAHSEKPYISVEGIDIPIGGRRGRPSI